MRFWVLILTLFSLSQAYAQTDGSDWDHDGTQYQNFFQTLDRAQKLSQMRSNYVCIDDGLACPIPENRCLNFMDDHCRLGKLGEKIRRLFKEPYTPRSDEGSPIDPARQIGFFVDHPPSDIKNVCKNYSRFDRTTREKFWIYMLMQLAYDESSCNSSKANNSHTAGAFQVEQQNKKREAVRPSICANKNFKKIYGKNAKIRDLNVNLHCAMAMLAVQLAPPQSKYSEVRDDLQTLSTGTLFSPRSHWGKLRPPHGRVAKNLRKFPACNSGRT